MPSPKGRKPYPNPDKQAPEAKAKAIKTVRLEYERQLHAMRRGYVQWRVNDLKQKHEERQRKAARPRPPEPPAFQPTFAEAMASASQADQLVIEKQIFSTLHRPQQGKNRGEGYLSERHQMLLAKQRKELINNYLALYHTAQGFITTPEQLETEVVRAFQDTGRGFEPFYPQSYQEILRDVEEGTAGGIFEGYTAKKYDEMGNDLYNAMMGTVAHGGPGYEEVMKEIQAALSGEEVTEAETLQNNSPQEGLRFEAFAREEAMEADRARRLMREEEERRQNIEILNSLSPPPSPEEPILLATDLDALDWQRKDFTYHQKAVANRPVPINDLNVAKSWSELTPILGDQQPPSVVFDQPHPTPARSIEPTAKEIEALHAKLAATESAPVEQNLLKDATDELASVGFEESSAVSEEEAATLVDETPGSGTIDLEIPVEQINDVPSEFEQPALQAQYDVDQNSELLAQLASEQTAEDQTITEQDLATPELESLEKLASQIPTKSTTTKAVNVEEVLSAEEEQLKMYRLRERYKSPPVILNDNRYRNGFSNIRHKYGFMPFDPDESPDLQFPSDMQSFITQSVPPTIVDQAEAHQKSKNPQSRSHNQILRILPTLEHRLIIRFRKEAIRTVPICV